MKASVIIPVHNGEKTLAFCLKSLQNQTIKNFETIVVDDGSTDSTLSIVKNFKNVKIVKQKKSGPSIARNNGAKKAKGKIIVFIDADCVASKSWLEQMLKPFNDSSVVGVQGAYKTKQKEIIARFIQIEIESRYQRLKTKSLTDWIGSYSAAYRKEIFLKEKGFSSDFKEASGEDPELSYKLSKKGHRLFFNSKAIVFHQHPNSLNDYLRKKFKHAFWRILLYRKHSDKIVRDSYTPSSLKLQLLALSLLGLLAFTSFFVPIAPIFAYFALILLFLTMLPLVFFALSQDFLIGLLSIPIILLRNLAFLLGLLMGIINLRGS